MDAAKGLTDTLLGTLPGQLDVALAVHGGEKLHTFTGFTANAGKLRDKAAGVQCRAGFTKLLDILRRVDSLGNVDVVLYIGDALRNPRRKPRSWRIASARAERGLSFCKMATTTTRAASSRALPSAPAAHCCRSIFRRSSGCAS